MRREGSSEDIVSKLPDYHAFRDQDGGNDPGLLPKALAGRVGHVLIHFPHGNYPHEENNKDPGIVNGVRGRDPKDGLHVEGVQLEYHDYRADPNDCKPPLHVLRVPPVILHPAVRSKLAQDTLELATFPWDGPQFPPVVRLPLQELESLDTQPDA